MSDLFHERLPWTVIDAVFAVMYEAHQHAFQVLTKRPERMREYVQSRPIGRIAHKVWWHLHQRDLDKAKLLSPEDIARDIAAMWPLPNVWLGVSVEDQERASRIDHLVQTPAAVRFISAEPLLGPLEFCDCDSHLTPVGRHFPRCRLKKINQVIVGGESGPNARPCNPDWVRLIRDQCETSGVAFFFKQWGSWAPWTPDDRHGVFGTPDTAISHFWEDENDRAISLRIGKKGAGRMLDWREWNEFPEGVKSC
jgi:protein gp37